MKIRLYEHPEDTYFNYLDLYLLLPVLVINEVNKDCIGENNYFTGIELDTKSTYIKSSIGWSFTLVVLGFGISLTRQYTY